jgi:hypothetical protein
MPRKTVALFVKVSWSRVCPCGRRQKKRPPTEGAKFAERHGRASALLGDGPEQSVEAELPPGPSIPALLGYLERADLVNYWPFDCPLLGGKS